MRGAVGIVSPVALALAWCVHGQPARPSAAAGSPAVQVLALGPVTPDAAPGQSLYLTRYVIAPQTTLPVHRHEGTQIGYIQSGTLTYSVVRGAVAVYRADANGRSERIDTVSSGQRRSLTAGQWVVETADAVHFAANRTAQPVVILTSALLRQAAPLATPVEP